jgi:hypothetical protein
MGFEHRPGDIVISTRSKHGTTWVQMICALLVFQDADLPAPLSHLSPWLDWLVVPRDEVFAQLDAQRHRRFVKTHTPLDGIPLDPRVTYIVVARHPLDAAVSLYHQGQNIDRARLRRLTGQPDADQHAQGRPPVHEWLAGWVDHDPAPREELDSLPGVMWHLSDAWARTRAADVMLIHYADLSADLERTMRSLADRLDITVREPVLPRLVAAARFEAMRERAALLAPNPQGVLRDSKAFFRRGRSGSGAALLTEHELARYEDRAAHLAPIHLLNWLHRP